MISDEMRRQLDWYIRIWNRLVQEASDMPEETDEVIWSRERQQMDGLAERQSIRDRRGAWGDEMERTIEQRLVDDVCRAFRECKEAGYEPNHIAMSSATLKGLKADECRTMKYRDGTETFMSLLIHRDEDMEYCTARVMTTETAFTLGYISELPGVGSGEEKESAGA